MSSNQTTSSSTHAIEVIGRFGAATHFDDLPAHVVEKLRACLLFNCGVARAGVHAVRDEMAAHLSLVGGLPRARAFSGVGAGPEEQVAFANAFAMHARAQDDFQHSAHTHIGAVAIPALLALAQPRNVSGRDFLAGMAVAYQVSSVVGSIAAWETSARGLRATPVYGPLGAAAGCARALGLDEHEIGVAVGIATNAAVGISQTWVDGTNDWRMQVGNASQSAVRATLMASNGMDVAPNTLEGQFGFFPVVIGRDLDVAHLQGGLENEWATSAVAFKRYPVCGINQGPVANAIELRDRTGLVADSIRTVLLEMTREDATYPGVAEDGPFRGPGGALMSAPYTVALGLAHGEVAFRRINDPTDEVALSIAERTSIEISDELSELSHVLTVVDADGTEHVSRYLRDDSASWDRHQAKAIHQTLARETDDPLLRGVELEEAIWSLDDKSSLHRLIELLTTSPGHNG